MDRTRSSSTGRIDRRLATAADEASGSLSRRLSTGALGLTLAGGLLLAACSGGSTETTAGAPATTAAASSSTAATGGSDAAPASAPGVSVPQLEFTAAAVGGGQVVGSELAGKDLVVWFWAPW